MTEPISTDRYTLYLGDCLDWLPTLAAGSIDAVVIDPPWMDYATGHYDASAWHAPIKYLTPDKYLPECYRVLRDNTALILWCRWDCFQLHADAVTRAGFLVRNCIVWAKGNHTAGDLVGNLGNKHEMAVFATKGRWQRHAKRETNLWEVPHLFSRAKRDHPTQKPTPLMERAIELTTLPGGVVLDCFMGSGTTGEAALNTGRRFVGMEQEAMYFAIGVDRLARAAARAVQPALLCEVGA